MSVDLEQSLVDADTGMMQQFLEALQAEAQPSVIATETLLESSHAHLCVMVGTFLNTMNQIESIQKSIIRFT